MSDYQKFLAELQACDNQDKRERLSLDFSLARLPEQIQAAVQAAAVPRFFDRAFLNALLNQPFDEEQFAALIGFSYIEPYPGEGRFNVHERSRKLLQEKLWQEEETLYREISSRAFVYCEKQDQDDTTWRIETVYHQLIAEPEKGVGNLNNTCVDWLNPPHFAYDKAESLLQAAHEHQEMNRLTEKVTCYLLLNQAKVDIRYERNREAKEALQKIRLASIQDDHYLKREGLLSLGRVHFYLSEFNDAQQSYDEAMPLCRESKDRLYKAKYLQNLGDLHLRLFDFKKARRYYDKSLPLFNRIQLEQAHCLHGIGEVLLHLSKFKKSRSYFRSALKLYQKIGERMSEAHCILSLGKAHLACSELPEAQRQLEEALQLYRKINHQRGEANCLQSFGDLSIKTDEFIAAKQYYDEALDLAEHIHCPEGVAECWEGFAKLHQAQDQLQQAEECWRKAAEMYRNLAMPLREKYCLEQLSGGNVDRNGL